MLLIHTVAAGETLFSIARRYGVSLDALIATNQPPNPENLVIGQALIIPTPGLFYTVRPGDTLFAIAGIFGTTVSALAAANEIADVNLIYPGQRLRIPGWESLSYTVRPGDTLWRIAQSYNVPLSLLIRVNDIPNPDAIEIGQIVIVPVRDMDRRSLVTNGFIFPINTAAARRVLTPLAPLLTYISIFSFPVDGTGGIVIPDYAPTVQTARELDIAPLAVLTNFTAGNFSPDLARMVLADPMIRRQTLDRYVELIRQGNFAGAMVDFENMYPEDRPLYTDFIAALRARLEPLGLITSIAVAPKWADFPNAPWVGAFDYAALGNLVDFMYIMTYEWGWVGGPPQPIAPVNLVRQVLQYATSLVPASKVMQGIPLYGYDWPIPDTPETTAATVTPQQAILLAAIYGSSITYDPVAEAPTFTYTDAAGQGHEVWFEDARSIEAKYRATRDFNLMGAGYWQLLSDFPQHWVVLADMFDVVKIAR